MLKNLNNYFIVFDLDDTLYPEIDYKKSGYEYLKKNLSEKFDRKIEIEIEKIIHKKDHDFLELLCDNLSLPYACKDSLLWSYRLHVPNINLSPDIKLLLEKIKSAKIKTSIITDGRSLTQRLKINKLKLENIPFFISEEYGSEKPNPYRFNLIMKKWPNKNYVYVADNPLKDFQAPMELGWFCIGADWFNNKIYKNFSTMKTIQPHIWLDNPMLLFSVLEDKSCYQTNL